MGVLAAGIDCSFFSANMDFFVAQLIPMQPSLQHKIQLVEEKRSLFNHTHKFTNNKLTTEKNSHEIAHYY